MKTWFVRLLGVLILGAVGLEIYTRLPTNAELKPLDLAPDTRYAVLLFHGTNGKDEPLLIDVAERIEAEIGGQDGIAVRHVVWSPWSDNRLRAAKHAQAIGDALGSELARLHDLRHIRLIAHSAGAYLLTPLCSKYKSIAPDPAHLEMTYLDGMGIQGAWDYFYGYRHYGECADYSRAIYSIDPVPGTNAPLQQSFNSDVTNHPTRSDIPSHLWPIEYFLETLTRDELTPGLRSHDSLPRGETRTE